MGRYDLNFKLSILLFSLLNMLLAGCGGSSVSDKKIAAETTPTKTLTVTVKNGGSIISEPAGINCGSDCSESYTKGKKIERKATPKNNNYVFRGWGGDCSGADSLFTVIMDEGRNCSADFVSFKLSDTKLFIDNGDGTITDKNTGLIWQKKDSDTVSATWSAAKDHCAAKGSDWRLPNLLELMSIINYVRSSSASTTGGDYSSNTDHPSYWSSSYYGNRPGKLGKAWYVELDTAFVFYKWQTEEMLVRCVRGRRPLVTAFTANSDTVIDNNTGLVWQRNGKTGCDIKSKCNWKEAGTLCEELELAGKTDWRLPSVLELRSIVDVSTENKPVIDQNLFTNTASFYYWSSTITTQDVNNAWVVEFEYGNTDRYFLSNRGYVRCVRDGQ